MKNLIKTSCFILASTLLISCSKEIDKGSMNELLEITKVSGETSNRENQTELNLEERITFTSSTNYISDLMFSFGVDSIDVIEIENKIIYSPISKKNFFLNEEEYDYGNYEIVFEDNFVYLNSNPEVKLSITTSDELYISSPEYTGIIDSENENITSESTNPLLIIFLNELVTDSSTKQERLAPNPTIYTSVGSCAWYDMITHSSYGRSRSVAAANADVDFRVLEFYYEASGSGCEPFGGIDISCFYENHFCIATYSFCCDD